MEQQVLAAIKEQLEDMYLAERKVAEYILSNPQTAIRQNVTDLAEASGVSDATVIRVCKRLGYTGFYQMKIYLAEELGRSQFTGYQDSATNPKCGKEVIQCLTRDLLRIADLLDEEKLQHCVNMICNSRRVFICAVGNTIPVAMDFSFRLCRLGINASCDVIAEHGLASMVCGDEKDLLIAVSHSGSSKYVVQTVEVANRKSMQTMAVTGSSSSPIARKVQYALLTTVENPLFGELGAASHIYEQAVLDAILYFVSVRQDAEPNREGIETILAEYKI